jgi:predicted dehydrogenase
LDEKYGANGSLPHVVGPHLEQEESHVYEDIMQLVDWIRDGKPTIATAEHARHVIEIFDAAYRSAQSGQAQTLRTTF